MIARTGSIGVVTLVLVLAAACGSGAGPASPTSTTSATSGTETTEEPADFPTAAFAAISEDPVTEDLAAELQAALARHDVADGGGMSATVMTAEGTWSGTTGKADGVRDLQVDDQFAIASITKSVVAAQVMLMVEAGELGLDDPVADHLPEDLQFDTNEATIRQLLSHRSGIPDYYDLLDDSQQTEPQRVWTPTEILDLLPDRRTPPGRTFSYAETNYLLLRLVIEHLRGRPLADVLRDGALAIDGLERLVHQPDESPTEPMAMPAGASDAALELGGGYLPSLASATAYHASGAIASDSPSLARWWRALCAGEIVSRTSLTEMSTFEPAPHLGSYGLGVYNPANGYAAGIGHTGQLPGYMSWAACLPEDEAVIVVLTNHEVDDGHLAFSHGLARPLVDALRSR
jgi:D-alanyl-D-alanine carboxypeptidase